MQTLLKAPIRQKQLMLILGDALIVLTAFSMAYLFRILIYEGGSLFEFWARLSWLVPIGVLIHIILFYIFELYDIEHKRPDAKLFLWLILSVLLATFLITTTSYLFPKYKMGNIPIPV